MQHDVIFIGSQFRNNSIFYDYMMRSITDSLHHIDTIKFYDDSDKNLFLTLETMLHTPSKLVLVCSKSSFSVVGKLLCTMTQDIQIVKDDMLMPSQTKSYKANSYLLEINETEVNVIATEVNKRIPPFLFEQKSHMQKLHLFDQDESDLKLLLSPLAESLDVTFKITTFIEGWHIIDVESSKYGELTSFINASLSLLEGKVIATTNILKYIIEVLDRNHLKVTAAESCTGGLLSSLLTKESGSSNVFDGGIVTYSNEKKNQWLGVEESILQEYGAVSKETVLAMSKGAKDVADADFAMSVSGIAGPTGESDEKPVGLVYLGICTKDMHTFMRLQLSGDRNYIQIQSAYHALKMLLLSDRSLFFENQEKNLDKGVLV